jgi:NhaP-type Na+/H+ or K+/H+ antiporter
LIGIGLGVILYFTHGSDEHYQLNTRTFFIIILPPIIIDAGYFMPVRPFFDQFGTIVLFAVLGTMVTMTSFK